MRKGFTLIELLVVILILSILAGVLGIAVVSVFGSGKKSEAEGTIKLLRAAIESFETHNRVIPSSSMVVLASLFPTPDSSGVVDPNTTNKGIETLVYALRAKGLSSGKLLGDEDFDRLRCNTDSDGGAEVIAVNFLNIEGNPLAWEVKDPWGNPYVYVCFNDETTPIGLDPLIPLILADGSTVEIDLTILKEKLIDPDTGMSRARQYALWSFGADGINDYGRGDDIVSWVKFDE